MTQQKENFGISLRSFESQVLYFNGMYKLPVAAYPTLDAEGKYQAERHSDNLMGNRDGVIHRISAFMEILRKEVIEGNDIIEKIVDPLVDEAGILTELADWLGDIIVYCTSEAARYGIPLQEVLPIIMASNFSKLDANGKPIYDALGKVEKGPFYWKPEPRIRELLMERIKENVR